MKNPTVSVIMSVYNGEKYLRQAIESILNQTFSDFEFIIVDDGSTDKTPEILKDYAKKDLRLKIVKNRKRIGLTKSLNEAIKQAKGKYIARQDADDISLPERLEKQITFLEKNPSYGAVGTSAAIIDKNGRIIKKAMVPKSWLVIKQILKFGNCFVHGSMMFKKQDYIKAGGYRTPFALAQDFDLWLRMSKIKKMKNLRECLYLWRKTESGLSAIKTDIQFKIGALALYEHKYHKSLKLNDRFKVDDYISKLEVDERRKYYKCLANLYLRHGNIKMAEKYYSAQNLSDKIFLHMMKLIIKAVKLRRGYY
jgi:glycosyltransferase involved in cell wall biosynthesis